MAEVTAATIIIPVTTNAGKASAQMTALDKSLDRTDKTLKKNTRSVKGLTTGYKALKAAVPIAGFFIIAKSFSTITKAASKAQETTNKFRVTFLGVVPEAQKVAKELQTAYGMGRQESEALLSATGDLLGGFGFTSAAALALSERVQKLAADTASFSNIEGGAKRASEALTKALLGETESAKALGIVIRENDVVARLAEKGLKGLTGQSLLQAKAAIRLSIAEEQSKNALGDVINTFNSAANVGRRVESRFNDIAASLGKDLLPALSDLGIAFLDASGDGGVLIGALKSIIGFTAGVIQGLAKLVNLLQEISNKSKAIDEANTVFGKQKSVLKSLQSQLAANAKMEKDGTDLAKIGTTVGKRKAEILLEIAKQQDILNDFKKTGNIITKTETTSIAKNAAATRASAKAIKAAIKARQDTLKIMSKAGSRGAQVALQEEQFKRQIELVRKAGLDVEQLERFQDQQRMSSRRQFLQNAIADETMSFAQREASLLEAFDTIKGVETLNYEERLAAQKSFTEQSQALETARMAAISAGIQTGVRVAREGLGIFQAVSQLQQNIIASDIQKMKDRGATEEEIAKKTRQLQRKAAKDQKTFGTISVLLDTAVAVASALTTKPFLPLGLAMATLAGIKGGVQLAAIQAAPIPAAAHGGKFVVPPGNEADSGLLNVSSGEEVNVTPARETNQQDEKVFLVLDSGEQLDAWLRKKMNQFANDGSFQLRRKGSLKVS